MTAWRDQPDETNNIRAEFADGTTAYTTVEIAANRLDFIDREKGIRDLLAGTQFRSHMGTMYSVVGIPVQAEPGSLAGRILGLDE